MISQTRLYRLLRAIVGPEYDAERFNFQAASGFSFTPDIDIQDIATLARIASGESWEGNVRDLLGLKAGAE